MQDLEIASLFSFTAFIVMRTELVRAGCEEEKNKGLSSSFREKTLIILPKYCEYTCC